MRRASSASLWLSVLDWNLSYISVLCDNAMALRLPMQIRTVWPAVTSALARTLVEGSSDRYPEL